MKEKIFAEIIDGLKVAQEAQTIKDVLAMISSERFRPSVARGIAFSKRLNEFVERYAADIMESYTVNFVEEDDFDPFDPKGTFQRQLELFKTKRTINIWKGASDNSIFGEPYTNWCFRLWHDYQHFTYELGYNTNDEILVGKRQAAELPQDWWYEKALIDAEVTGQVLYHAKHGDFPQDQRGFVINYLKTGII